MITALKFRIRLAIIAAAIVLAQMPVIGETNPTQSLVAGETAFALDLYGWLEPQPGNLFFSPYSISTCLGMTYAGARGETARQMAQTLHFDAGPTELPTPMGALEKELNEVRQEKAIELNTANGLWAQAGHPFLPAFVENVQQQFGASIKQVNFRSEAEAVRGEINDWVSHQTKGKINNLLQRGVIGGSTRLVLVNAIYFKGKWVNQFDKKNTAEAPFTLGDGQKVQAQMMFHEASYKYAETGDLQLLELPYTAGEPAKPVPTPLMQPGASPTAPPVDPLSMVVLLPKSVNGLKQLEDSFNPSALTNWMAQTHSEKVKVFLPKFRMTTQFSLADTLKAMGMTDAFSRQADFSGMDGRRDLFISAVVHKAYVDVNEEGTEAAAATGAAIRMLAVRPMPIIVFRADHPFIFLIRDTRSGSILFLGRVNDPTK